MVIARSPLCLRVPSQSNGWSASLTLAFKPNAATAASKPSLSSAGERLMCWMERLGGRLPPLTGITETEDLLSEAKLFYCPGSGNLSLTRL